MAWRFVRQPNGLFARFSEVVDDFTDYDMTFDEAVEFTLEILRSQAVEKVQRAVDSPGLDRWNEAVATIREVHGEKKTQERIKELSKEPTP